MKSAGIMKYLMRPIDIGASQFSKAPHSFSEFVTGIYQTSIVRIIDAVITVLDIEMIFQVETTPRIFHRNWKWFKFNECVFQFRYSPNFDAKSTKRNESWQKPQKQLSRNSKKLSCTQNGNLEKSNKYIFKAQNKRYKMFEFSEHNICSRKRINAYRALASPSLIALSSKVGGCQVPQPTCSWKSKWVGESD